MLAMEKCRLSIFCFTAALVVGASAVLLQNNNNATAQQASQTIYTRQETFPMQ